MATHSSVLAWGIPGMGGPGGLLSMGSHRVRHDWSNLAAADLIEKTLMLERLRQEEKRMTEDTIIRQHHQLNSLEFEQTLEHSEGQGILACWSLWCCKEDWRDCCKEDKTKETEEQQHIVLKLVPSSLKGFPLSFLHIYKIDFLITVVLKVQWRMSGLWWVMKREKWCSQPGKSAPMLREEEWSKISEDGQKSTFSCWRHTGVICTEQTSHVALGLYSNLDYDKFSQCLEDYWALIFVPVVIDKPIPFSLITLGWWKVNYDICLSALTLKNSLTHFDHI